MPASARFRRSIAAAVALASLLLTAPGASARPDLSATVAPNALIEQQIAALTEGTAILQFDPARLRQGALITQLRALGLRGMRYQVLPMVAVEGTLQQVRTAARLPGVVAVHQDEKITFDVKESVPLILENTVAQTRARGLTGFGSTIAVVDSGANELHNDLRKPVTHNVKFVDEPLLELFGLPTTVVCTMFCNTDTSSGHGSHVAGIMAGNGKLSSGIYTGVAPGASVVSLGVGDADRLFYAVGAFDYILANPQLGILAVNNSWGRSQSDGRGRFDYTHPVNVASKALHDAGVSVVFTAGNTGTGDRTDEPGASTCDTVASGSTRVAGPGVCRFTVYGSAPWAISVAAGRKDNPGFNPGAQYLAYFSSRGDTVEQISLDGQPVRYAPTLTAPGVNIKSVRNPNGAFSGPAACASAEPIACTPLEGRGKAYEAFYVPMSGTSMAAPHVTGAIAVIQQMARWHLGRNLSPDEVKSVLVQSASVMTGTDGYWDFPCGTPATIECGTSVATDDRWTDLSGTVYEPYQVGAGYLNLAAAIRLVESL